jgi:hypothetical protein
MVISNTCVFPGGNPNPEVGFILENPSYILFQGGQGGGAGGGTYGSGNAEVSLTYETDLSAGVQYNFIESAVTYFSHTSTGSSSFELQLVPVPEPASAATILMISGALLFRRSHKGSP